MSLSVVGHRAIAVDELQQIDIRRAESQSWSGVEFRLDTHIMRGVSDVADANFLTNLHGNRIDTLSESYFQRHRVTGEIAVGIGRRPSHFLTFIHHLHGKITVAATVTRRKSLVHCFGIDEKFEGGSRLAHGRHLVVFPRFEINIAHPGLYMTGFCLKCYETTVHEMDHIADGVHRRELFLNLSTVIVEDFYSVRKVEIIIDGILISVEFLREIFVDRLALSDILDEVLDFLMTLILPGISRTPVGVEVTLHLSHLLAGSLFGIFLHAGVDGCVDLQTFGIKGITVVKVFLAPVFQIIGHSLAEVISIAVVGRLHAVVESDVELLERVTLFSGQVTMLLHEVQNDITTLQRILGIDEGIIIGGSLEHTHEDGCVLRCQVLGLAVEVGLAGSFDTEGIGTKINGIGILRENLVLGKEILELVGSNPLLALHDKHFQPRDIAQKTCRVFATGAEEILSQLLGDG